MPFARRVFRIAGLSGVLIVLPMYFIERQYGIDYPPAITHPEFFYGFVGVTLACQVMFLIISTDPIRYRPVMIAGIVEKVTYGAAILWLVGAGRTPGVLGVTAAVDLTFGALFLAAFLGTASYQAGSRPGSTHAGVRPL